MRKTRTSRRNLSRKRKRKTRKTSRRNLFRRKESHPELAKGT